MDDSNLAAWVQKMGALCLAVHAAQPDTGIVGHLGTVPGRDEELIAAGANRGLSGAGCGATVSPEPSLSMEEPERSEPDPGSGAPITTCRDGATAR